MQEVEIELGAFITQNAYGVVTYPQHFREGWITEIVPKQYMTVTNYNSFYRIPWTITLKGYDVKEKPKKINIIVVEIDEKLYGRYPENPNILTEVCPAC